MQALQPLGGGGVGRVCEAGELQCWVRVALLMVQLVPRFPGSGRLVGVPEDSFRDLRPGVGHPCQ